MKEKEEKRAFREILKNKRDPKRSVYYDEVWNPYGVPPPGLPWKERDEDDSEGMYLRKTGLRAGWSTDSDVRRIPMPRDTPPATTKKPKVQAPQLARRDEAPPPQPKPVQKISEPEEQKVGPSDTIEEAFLRAGASVIEAAPVLRDFQKEAVGFVPSIVKRRLLPNQKPKKAEQTVKEDVEGNGNKSFATTIEDADEEELVQTNPKDVVPEDPSVALLEATSKRPLEIEKKSEVESVVTAAPLKRRRLVNAAPDV